MEQITNHSVLTPLAMPLSGQAWILMRNESQAGCFVNFLNKNVHLVESKEIIEDANISLFPVGVGLRCPDTRRVGSLLPAMRIASTTWRECTPMAFAVAGVESFCLKIWDFQLLEGKNVAGQQIVLENEKLARSFEFVPEK
jgi:hypothetical protein